MTKRLFTHAISVSNRLIKLKTHIELFSKELIYYYNPQIIVEGTVLGQFVDKDLVVYPEQQDSSFYINTLISTSYMKKYLLKKNPELI